MIHRQNQRRRRGGVLVMFALAMVVIIGCSGLAVDIGRMYVNRTEAQSYVDARALAEAVHMLEVLTNIEPDQAWKLHDFNNQPFQSVDVEYLGNSVRVTATVDVPLLLLPVILLGQNTGTVSAVAVASIERVTSMGEGGFPYAIRGSPGGFVPGETYTFRWGNNVSKDLEDAWGYVVQRGPPTLTHEERLDFTARILRGDSTVRSDLGATANLPNINVWCTGHATLEFLQEIDRQDSLADGKVDGLFDWNGAYFQGGTNLIVAALAHGYQDQVISYDPPTSISITTGVRQATINELRDVINSDDDPTSILPTYALVTDDSPGTGTGERIIYSPIVSDVNTMFLKPGSGASTLVVDIDAFLLLPASEYGNPQSNWCAQYAGGRYDATGGSVNQGSGVWTVRLTQ
jgi:hypothetical protein